MAKAYRLLHAIFTTAADQDRIVRRNPCSIDGGLRRENIDLDTCEVRA